MSELNKSVQYLKGVGPVKAKLLKKMHINTIEDILYYFPRSYDDRRSFNKISQCKDGEDVNLKVTITAKGTISKPRKKFSVIKIPCKDDTGFGHLVWFNQRYMKNQFEIGEEVYVHGKVKRVYNQIQIMNPEYQRQLDQKNRVGKIIPIYSLTDKITNNDMIKLVKHAVSNYLDGIDDVLPEYITKSFDMVALNQAIKNMHFPSDRIHYKRAKERLVFEEFLLLQLGLLLIKTNYNNNQRGIRFENVKKTEDCIQDLPFQLTKAQVKVLKEIRKDLNSEKTMSRLVQGDVGSGKTIIAILSMLEVVFNGYQAAMMAPTEILATQHYESISKMVEVYGVRCDLLVGSMKKKEKEKLLNKIKKGEVDIVIGTHALIQESVAFSKLGLAVTDEQHRFGVRQRAVLTNKGKNPDILVMTATPIPRTLALILYGDLDISLIDELPPGRKQIKTYAVDKSYKERVYKFIREQVDGGRQAYIVCPLIEESETLDIQSALELYEELNHDQFMDYRVELLHGKMKNEEKDAIMLQFKQGLIDILVATTVIEVGVNVPNANIMVIENAERFGLAQLHQLRGRVGRGNYQSYCVLINNGKGKVAKERMSIMEKTTDGFIISEKDLEIRGPGEFFGTKQHGLPELKVANIFKDIESLKTAQKVAQDILKKDPELEQSKHKKMKEKINRLFKEKMETTTLN